MEGDHGPESKSFLEGGMYLCRKPLFFKVSLVTLKTVTSPHTHCLRMLFSVSLLNPSCRETSGKPFRRAQTHSDSWPGAQLQPRLHPSCSPCCIPCCINIESGWQHEVVSKGMQAVYMCSRKYVCNAVASSQIWAGAFCGQCCGLGFLEQC